MLLTKLLLIDLKPIQFFSACQEGKCLHDDTLTFSVDRKDITNYLCDFRFIGKILKPWSVGTCSRTSHEGERASGQVVGTCLSI